MAEPHGILIGTGKDFEGILLRMKQAVTGFLKKNYLEIYENNIIIF